MQRSKSGRGIKSHTYADRERYGHLYGGPRWKKQIQPMILRRDPVCKSCDVALSEIADHIVPAGVAIEQAAASGKWPLNPFAGFYLMSNLTGLVPELPQTKDGRGQSAPGRVAVCAGGAR
jgi:hypothetical protein